MTITTLNTNEDYEYNLSQWKLVRDCLAGAKTVKDAGTEYLPQPNPLDKTTENSERYLQYKKRAQFVNFTARSARGFVGLVRKREPIIDLPTQLEYLIDSATSTGVGLAQCADDTVLSGLVTGRRGLLANYPEQPDNLSKAETQALGGRGVICTYEAEHIPEWHESIVNGVRVLDFVKLVEIVEKMNEDNITIDKEYQYRVLRLRREETLGDDGVTISYGKPVYTQTLYEDKALTKVISDEVAPKQSDGSTFDFIPFIFFGSESNDPKVDPAALYDIADLNIGHYRNSADYEESAFIVGQPMVGIVTDIGADQWRAANPTFGFGCRVATFLGANGDIKLVQAQPNTLAKEAMDSKENQLKMIGAKIIETNTTVETATAAIITNGAENSVLGKIVLNAQDAIKKVIGWIGLFEGAETEDAVFELNTVFYEPGTDPQAVMASIALYDRSIIAKADVQDYARKQGVVSPERTNEDIDKEAVDNGMDTI